MLVHVANVLDASTLASITTALAAADWVDGRETVGAQGAQVKRNQQLGDASSLRAELGARVSRALHQHPLFHAAALPARMLPPRFNRYQGGGQYGFHVDGAVMALPQGGQLRSDIACTVFLSEPGDYDGGELIVSDTYGEHEVKLPAGDAIVYPASSLHRVAPVTRGARIASFFWIQSLVPDPSLRQLLLEMDTSIQKLTAEGADSAALLQLTGVYHNLLRRWSQT